MLHKKTYDAIDKLREVELELHRLKNALERTDDALDKCLEEKEYKKEWIGLTDDEIDNYAFPHFIKNELPSLRLVVRILEDKLKEKNHG